MELAKVKYTGYQTFLKFIIVSREKNYMTKLENIQNPPSGKDLAFFNISFTIGQISIEFYKK